MINTVIQGTDDDLPGFGGFFSGLSAAGLEDFLLSVEGTADDERDLDHGDQLPEKELSCVTFSYQSF